MGPLRDTRAHPPPMSVLVLVAADDSAVRARLRDACRAAGHAVQTCALAQAPPEAERTGAAAALLWAADPAAVAVAARGLVAEQPALAVIACVPAQAVAAAVAALAPTTAAVADADGPPGALAGALATALRLRGATRERDRLRTGAELVLAGSSGEARRLRGQVERVASTPRTTVLLLGREDDGVIEVARLLHVRSARAAGPLQEHRARDLDSAAALDTALAEADGGCLHLLAVHELEPAAQGRLAAHLDGRRPTATEEGEARPPDVRLIASTELDLAHPEAADALREDLVYRLNVLTLRVPALSERRADVPDLCGHALRSAAQARSTPPTGFSVEALEALEAHAFPGSLAELRARMELASHLAAGRDVGPDDLGLGVDVRALAPTQPPATLPSEEVIPLLDRSLEAVEEALIRRVLQEERGNKSRAARVLGMHRATLYNKLRRYGFPEDEPA